MQGDIMAQQALQACGLYNFWCLGSLRAKPRLLQLLVDYSNPEYDTFQIDGMSLSVEVEDIYFITGLSRRGEMVNLRSRGPGGGLTTDEYIAMYYFMEMETCMMEAKNLPPKYWAEAINCAAYIQNRVPHKQLDGHGLESQQRRGRLCSPKAKSVFLLDTLKIKKGTI